MPKQSRAQRIAALNDKFRKNLVSGGRTYMTAGVNGRGAEFVAKALIKVIAFNEFNAKNDPHGEHKGEFGSEDPTDPKTTMRVLTVMLAEEY
jgi:hypothetical protein